jgi:hypothetical protein
MTQIINDIITIVGIAISTYIIYLIYIKITDSNHTKNNHIMAFFIGIIIGLIVAIINQPVDDIISSSDSISDVSDIYVK